MPNYNSKRWEKKVPPRLSDAVGFFINLLPMTSSENNPEESPWLVHQLVNNKAFIDLAHNLAYGMHRPSVWEIRLMDNGDKELIVSPIDDKGVWEQSEFVFRGLKYTHDQLLKVINNGKYLLLYRHIVINLLNRVASVLIKKSFQVSSDCLKKDIDDKYTYSYSLKVINDLTEKGLDLTALTKEDKIQILLFIHAAESSDQRIIFLKVMERYKSMLPNMYQHNGIYGDIINHIEALLDHGTISCLSLLDDNNVFMGNHPQQNPTECFADFLKRGYTYSFFSRRFVDKKRGRPFFDRSLTWAQATDINKSTLSPTSIIQCMDDDINNDNPFPQYSLFGGYSIADVAREALAKLQRDEPQLLTSGPI